MTLTGLKKASHLALSNFPVEWTLPFLTKTLSNPDCQVRQAVYSFLPVFLPIRVLGSLSAPPKNSTTSYKPPAPSKEASQLVSALILALEKDLGAVSNGQLLQTHVLAALSCVASLSIPSLASSVAPFVASVIDHGSSASRRRAVLVLYHIMDLHPPAVSAHFETLKAALSASDPAVASAAAEVFASLTRRSPTTAAPYVNDVLSALHRDAKRYSSQSASTTNKSSLTISLSSLPESSSSRFIGFSLIKLLKTVKWLLDAQVSLNESAQSILADSLALILDDHENHAAIIDVEAALLVAKWVGPHTSSLVPLAMKRCRASLQASVSALAAHGNDLNVAVPIAQHDPSEPLHSSLSPATIVAVNQTHLSLKAVVGMMSSAPVDLAPHLDYDKDTHVLLSLIHAQDGPTRWRALNALIGLLRSDNAPIISKTLEELASSTSDPHLTFLGEFGLLKLLQVYPTAAPRSTEVILGALTLQAPGANKVGNEMQRSRLQTLAVSVLPKAVTPDSIGNIVNTLLPWLGRPPSGLSQEAFVGLILDVCCHNGHRCIPAWTWYSNLLQELAQAAPDMERIGTELDFVALQQASGSSPVGSGGSPAASPRGPPILTRHAIAPSTSNMAIPIPLDVRGNQTPLKPIATDRTSSVATKAKARRESSAAKRALLRVSSSKDALTDPSLVSFSTRTA